MKFYHYTTAAEVRSLIAWHNEHSEFCVLDTETTDKDARKAKLIDIQMTGRGEDEAVMFSAEFLPLLRELNITQVLWNFKYDWEVACLHGTDLSDKPMRDGMLLDHLVDENREHSLDRRVQEWYGDNYKQEFWSKYKLYTDAPFDERLTYSCKDIVYTGRVYRRLKDALISEKIPPSVVEHVHELARALYKTEVRGIAVDLDYTIKMGTELKEDILRTEKELRELGGHYCELVELQQWTKEVDKLWTPTGNKWRTVEKPAFNFASSGQVNQLLYDGLKLPPQYKWDRANKQRKLTADDSALEELQFLHPIITPIRRYRKYTKMYGSFIEGVLDKVQDGRIYPSFNVNGTKAAGRISHAEPNVAQMPSKEDEFGSWSKIRGIFIPNEDCKIVTCDYGMLEVVIAAHFSQDKNLLKIIYEGASKHDITAQALGVPRATAKTLNFAFQYLCGPNKAAQILGCSKADGQLAWNKYWETYSGERKVIDQCRALIAAGEPIVNIMGRRRRLPKTFKNEWELEAAVRQGYSAKIQGSGSEFTSYSFYKVSNAMERNNWGRGLFTVHDELLVEPFTKHVDVVSKLTQDTMIAAGPELGLSLPLTVSCSGALERWQKWVEIVLNK